MHGPNMIRKSTKKCSMPLVRHPKRETSVEQNRKEKSRHSLVSYAQIYMIEISLEFYHPKYKGTMAPHKNRNIVASSLTTKRTASVGALNEYKRSSILMGLSAALLSSPWKMPSLNYFRKSSS